MKRRRSRQYESEEALQLGEVLEPYDDQQWSDENAYPQETYVQQDQYPEAYMEGYEEFYGDEYSEEHEAADMESRFRIAIGVFDLISIIIGIVVILLLVGMFVTLLDWLQNDILHSSLLLQSGLQ